MSPWLGLDAVHLNLAGVPLYPPTRTEITALDLERMYGEWPLHGLVQAANASPRPIGDLTLRPDPDGAARADTAPVAGFSMGDSLR